MTTSSSRSDRIAELAELLRKYKDAYYNGKAIVSDVAYDALEDELRALDPEHSVLKSVGAPLPEVVTEWEKARHAIPMGSLNKAVNEEEFRQWAARCDQLGAASDLPPISNNLLVTEKLDGLSLAVNYENGQLVEAITRGDGHVGERITPNARRMKGVPARLPEPLTVSIRGEIILKLSDMRRAFPGYDAPPRNKAAGTSKRFDGSGCEHLTVMFYDFEGLLAVGVVPVAPSAGGALAGKTFCFTGTLPLPRKTYEDLVVKHGGSVLSGVTKDLTYLVMADPSTASTKAEKARKYGTQCIDVVTLERLVEDASGASDV